MISIFRHPCQAFFERVRSAEQTKTTAEPLEVAQEDTRQKSLVAAEESAGRRVLPASWAADRADQSLEHETERAAESVVEEAAFEP